MTNDHADSEHPAISDRERELLIFEMTEMAKAKLIKWLRSAAAVVVVVLTLFGLKAYTDYRTALGTIDAKIAERVREEVAEYRKFTDQIISEVVDAKTRTNVYRNEMAGLEDRMTKLKNAQASYEGELARLGKQALQRYDEFNLTLVELRVTPRESAALASEQAAFITRSEAFAKKIGLRLSAPPILFEPIENENIQAIFDAERGAYVVNTRWLGRAEYLPEYVAIMGRFMALHYNRLFGDENATSVADVDLWNSFRMSLQKYLIEANTESDSEFISGDDSLYRFLSELQGRTDVATATQFAVTLLTEYKSTWTSAALPSTLKEINRKKQIVPADKLDVSINAIWTAD